MKTPIMSNTAAGTAPSTSATTYTSIHMSGQNWSTTESTNFNVAPYNIQIQNLKIRLTTAPANGGGTQQYVFTVRKNGTTDLAVTCTIQEASTTCSDTTNVALISAGEWYTISATPSGTPASPGEMYWSAEVSSGTRQAVITGDTPTGPSNSTTVYTGVAYNSAWDSTEATRSMVWSPPGTVATLYVMMATAPGAGTSYAFTMMKNGSAQTVTCTISDTATSCSDTAHSFTVVAGDLISLRSVPTNSPTTAVVGWGIGFEPTNDGESPIMWRRNDNLNTGAAQFCPLFGNAAQSTTESTPPLVPGPDMTIKNLYVSLSAAPGAGTSYAFNLRQNGGNESITCTVADAATTCNDLTNIEVVPGGSSQIWNTGVTPTGTPTARTPRIGYTAYIAPPSTLDAGVFDAATFN